MKKGSRHSTETKAKISIARRGKCRGQENPMYDKQHTPEIRAKISTALKGNKNHFGKRHSLETRMKIAAARRGKQHSPETRMKMSDAHRGKHHRPEAIVKIAVALKGRKQTTEHRAKNAAAHLGAKNPAWLGGVKHKPYAWTFNGELKEEVRRRDGQRCQLCGVPQAECKRKLSVHHINYDKKDSDPINLIALCGGCNVRVNIHREHWVVYFRTIMIKRSIGGFEREESMHLYQQTPQQTLGGIQGEI